MPLYVGGKKIGALYVGSRKIARAYIGTKKVLDEIKAPKVLTFIGTQIGNNAASQGFLFNAGQAAPDKRVIVAVGSAGATSEISGVVVSGGSPQWVVPATEIRRVPRFGANNIRLGLHIAHVPAAAGNVTITVNHTGGVSGKRVAAWSATGLTSNTPIDSNLTNLSDPLSLTLDTVSGGFCVAFTVGGTSTSYTWTGANPVFGELVFSTNFRMSGASSGTTGSSINVEADSGTVTNHGMIAATF